MPENWNQTSRELPHPDSKVEWLGPDGSSIRGTFAGFDKWIPDGPQFFIAYEPVFWRYVNAR